MRMKMEEGEGKEGEGKRNKEENDSSMILAGHQRVVTDLQWIFCVPCG